MSQPRPELDSGYYLQHFNELLQFTVQHYQAVLSAESTAFIDDFKQQVLDYKNKQIVA